MTEAWHSCTIVITHPLRPFFKKLLPRRYGRIIVLVGGQYSQHNVRKVILLKW